MLIPRPETELLVELALELEPATRARRRHRLGRDRARGRRRAAAAPRSTATDTSLDALAVAQANRDRLGLGDRVRLAYGSLEPGPFDLLLANLPVRQRGRVGRAWSPRSASTSRARRWSRGPTGLEAIDACSASSRSRPSRRGAIGLEVGLGQARTVAELVRRAGYERIEIRPDLAGIDRVVVGMASERRDARRLRARRAGWPCFPADGLYGLACDPTRADAIERIHRIKGRDDGKPSAVMYFSPLAMRELVAALGPRTRDALGALLPGPVTLVVANPERLYPLACREDPERLGLRLIGGPLAGAALRRLPDLGQPLGRAGAGALRGRRPRRSSPPSTWRSTAAS